MSFFKPPLIISCLLCVMLSVMWSGSEEENRSNDWKEKIYYVIYLKLVQLAACSGFCQLQSAHYRSALQRENYHVIA